MSQDLDIEDVQKSLHELFKYVFVTNCHLDEASITPEEMKTMDDLDSVEVIENFKDLVIDLLNFKKELKSSEISDLAKRNIQFERQIQKLESEVRRHIRLEHQLKLHIETAQNKLDEFESNSFTTKINRLKDKVKEKDMLCNSLGSDLRDLKDKFLNKCKENDMLKQEIVSIKKENKRPDSRSNTLKRRIEAKTKEINKYQQLMKSNESRPRSARKSLGETDIFKSTTSLKVKQSSRKLCTKKYTKNLRGHFRTQSDYKTGRK